MRPIFKNKDLENQFHKNGYVIVSFLNKDQIQQIEGVYHKNFSGITTGFYSTLYSNDNSYKAKIDDEIKEICIHNHLEVLDNYKWLVANFMIKEPGPESELPVHQDWNLVDEENYISVNCWMPITPVTKSNGPLNGQGSIKFR